LSPMVIAELRLLSHSFLLGIKIAIVYDGVRIFRAVLRHKKTFSAVEDLVFWLYVFIESFALLLRENNGTLRWFLVAFAGLGVVAYKTAMGDKIVDYCALFIQKITRYVIKITNAILRPFKRIFGIVGTKTANAAAIAGGKAKNRFQIALKLFGEKKRSAGYRLHEKTIQWKILAGKNFIKLRKRKRRILAKIRKRLKPER